MSESQGERSRREDEDEDEDGDIPDQPGEDGEEGAGSDEEEQEQPLPPAKRPEINPNIFMAVGTAQQLDIADVRSLFSGRTADFIRSGRAGFAVRLHGPGVQRDFIDAVVLATVLEPLARAARWVGGSVTRHAGVDPGVNAVFTGASLVVHFTLAEDENPVRVNKDLTIAPTVAAGRYLAALTAVVQREKLLLERVAPLGKRAVSRYAQTLKQLRDHRLSVDWLTKERELARATPSAASKGYRTLHSAPEMRERVSEVTGYLEMVAAQSRRFRMLVEEGSYLGTFVPEAEDSLDGAWNHDVIARIRVVEPVNPSLPRAPSPHYELLEVLNIRNTRR